MPLKKKVCWECKGRQYVFKQNIDGEFDCAKGAQTRAYRRSIERYGTRAAWMAFIDLDEFIVVRAPMEPRSCMGWGTCLASVSSLVGGFNASSWPAVALPWRHGLELVEPG